MLTCHPPFALTTLAFPEMTRLAVLHALSPSVCEVAPVRFTPDDDFYDDDDTADLSDCAVALLSRAGSWSARKSRNGFVSASMLAKLSSDPDRAAEELCKRGIWRRGKKGGYQFTDWERWGDLAEDVRQREADEERRKEQGRVRAQRKRDRDKAAKGEVMAAGVTRYVTRYAPGPAGEPQAEGSGVTPGGTRASRSQERGVTRQKHPSKEKPQVNGSRVTRYEPDSSRVTAQVDTSDNQDLDPDQNQSVGVGVINAGAREAPPPAVVTLVAARISNRLSRPAAEAEACRAIAEWDRRAAAAGKAVRNPEKFYPACAGCEPLAKLEAIIAPPLSAEAREWQELGQVPEPPPGAHAFVSSGIKFDNSCMYPGCVVPEKNQVHVKEAKAI
jgi:hypothetical protein